MLKVTDGKIIESLTTTNSTDTWSSYGDGGVFTTSVAPNSAYVTYPNYFQTIWNSHPVYVCTDKTAKAIEILKNLEADKVLEVKSVKRFISLVEKIAGIL